MKKENDIKLSLKNKAASKIYHAYTCKQEGNNK